MYTETDPRAIAVLGRALRSGSRHTRLRAVAMLAQVHCDQRARWLAEASDDADLAVRQTALMVDAWVTAEEGGGWPQREDPAFDRLPSLGVPAEGPARPRSERSPAWRWEYAVEVWREDGLLVGAYLATSVEEDDEHAKRVALGQAILSSATPHGESFDPATAAAFIVGKRRVGASLFGDERTE